MHILDNLPPCPCSPDEQNSNNLISNTASWNVNHHSRIMHLGDGFARSVFLVWCSAHWRALTEDICRALFFPLSLIWYTPFTLEGKGFYFFILNFLDFLAESFRLCSVPDTWMGVWRVASALCWLVMMMPWSLWNWARINIKVEHHVQWINTASSSSSTTREYCKLWQLCTLLYNIQHGI